MAFIIEGIFIWFISVLKKEMESREEELRNIAVLHTNNKLIRLHTYIPNSWFEGCELWQNDAGWNFHQNKIDDKSKSKCRRANASFDV